MRALFALAVLAVPAAGLDRPRPASVMAARRAESRPSAMAARRVVASYVPGALALAPSVPSHVFAPAAPEAPPARPTAVPDPEFGPRLTPLRGTPAPPHNLSRTTGFKAEPAAPPSREGLPPFITSDRHDDKGPAGIKSEPPPSAPAVKVTELRVGSANRQFGGASDPVVFLTSPKP